MTSPIVISAQAADPVNNPPVYPNKEFVTVHLNKTQTTSPTPRLHSTPPPLRRALAAALSVLVITATTTLAGCAGSPPPTASTAAPTNAQPATTSTTGGTEITITIDGAQYAGTLNGSATAEDLASRLPLEVRFGPNTPDEKVGRLDTPLSVEGSPDSDDPLTGEIGYYIPWDALVLYNGDVGAAPGTVRIGTFNIDPALIAEKEGPFPVRFELAG